MTAINQILRWLPGIANSRRRAAIAITGLGLITGLAAGPAAAEAAETATAAATVTQTTQAPARALLNAADKPAMPAKAPSSKVLNHQFQFQPNFYYCGPAATRIALTAQGLYPSQDDLASRLGTTTNGTNSAEDTTRVLNSLGGTDFYRTTSIPGTSATPAEMNRLQSDIVRAISSGHPVVANIIGTATDTAGGQHAYPGGHYLTVVGYRDDGRTVKIADPADTTGGGSYWMASTSLANWMAERGYSA